MALPTIFWFTKIGEYSARIIPFVATFLGFMAWCYNIVEILIVGSLNAIYNAIASLDISALGGADFAAWTYIGFVNAIFPLSEALAMLGAFYIAWISIIVLRWVKSFIPTMAN
jgi:hypothetical protein